MLFDRDKYGGSETIDTTVDNLFDMNFKWNTSGGSLIVSNAIIQIL